MYVIKRMFGLRDEFGGRYLPVSITHIPLSEIYVRYSSVLVELEHQSDRKLYTLDMDKLDPEVKALEITFPQWLVKNPTLALPATDGALDIQYRYLTTYDAWLHEFKINLASIDYHPDMDIPRDMKQDLLLTKPLAHYWEMAKYCLYTVNGMIHRSDANDNGVYILQGGESGILADNNQVGIIDFQHIGEIEIFPITEGMIHAREGNSLRNSTYITLPKSVIGYTPMLVLGGYLHALDKTYSVVSDNIIKFDFSQYSWETRYLEMRKLINTESLGETEFPNGVISAAALWSDDVIRKLFSLPQSFLVYVKANKLTRTDIPLQYSQLPGVYYTYARPLYPVIIGNGRLAEFRASLQHGIFCLNMDGYLLDNPIRETTGFRASSGFTGQRVPDRPTRPAPARQMLISKIEGNVG